MAQGTDEYTTSMQLVSNLRLRRHAHRSSREIVSAVYSTPVAYEVIFLVISIAVVALDELHAQSGRTNGYSEIGSARCEHPPMLDRELFEAFLR